ncbi:spore germination protein [Peribacillus sp. NPDC097295]|uniref:spore germination protein n=1 Tax=Peribacillus sp. NPDC097295 TaxID=3364402 RepID=UPI003827F0CC
MVSFFKQRGRVKKNKNENKGSEKQMEEQQLSFSISENLKYLKQKTGNSADIVTRTLHISEDPLIKIVIVHVQGLVDTSTLTDFLIESIMKDPELQVNLTAEKALDVITNEVVSLGGVTIVEDWQKLFLSLLSGSTIIFIDGTNHVLAANTQGGQKRAVQEPTTHLAVRGSKEGFTESIETNIALVRRIINNPDLWVESMKIGTVTNTDVSIMYINGIAKEKVIKEVRKRLKSIHIDSILESGYIEQLIEDQAMTPFPTIDNTERPDMVAGNLLEGRVAIFVNGTPFVLLVPALFIQFFQSVEDYYNRFDIGTATRFLRIVVFLISLIGPALYIGATTFNQEMLPTQLLIAIAAQRESVPFPAFFEALIMEIAFEILREAGLRMPKAIGSTISIVGALVIGQAAVQAGVVSPAMVIIVSITAIASFATPSYSIAISARLLRFGFMLSAATLGLYGIILALFILIVHLCSLRSFGVPYMSPLAPFIPSEVGESIFRKPLWAMDKRPKFISSPKNQTREENSQKPQPPVSRGMKKARKKQGDNNESS